MDYARKPRRYLPAAHASLFQIRLSAGLTLVAACAALALAACSDSSGASTAHSGMAEHPVENGYISFSRYIPGGTHIFSVSPTGTDERQLTQDAGVQAHSAWSPSGTVVAFSQVDSDRSSIKTVNTVGGVVSTLVRDGAWALVPSWSPDGSRVAYTDDTTGDYQVYTVSVDGANVVQMTQAPSGTTYVGPKYSPDGKLLAFAMHRPQDAKGVQDLWVMNIDGSDPRRLTTGMNNAESRTWSPDGTRIAFNVVVNGVGQIFVINLDGTGLTQLTRNPGTTPAFAPGGIFPTMRGDVTPAWSPDGTRIAFASDSGGNFDVYTMKLDGSNIVQITKTPQQELSVGWGAQHSAS